MDLNDPAAETCRQALIRRVLRAAPQDGVHATAVPGLQLLRIGAPGQPLPALYEPGLVLVLQGAKQATLGDGERLVYDALHCLVVTVTMLPRAQVVQASAAQPYLCVRLNVDAHELAALLLEAAPALPPVSAAPPGRGAQVARVSAPLLDAVGRLLALLEQPRDLPVLAPLVQREIFYRVLTGELGPRLRALAVADSQAQRIARAVDLLRRRFREPLRVGELAAAAHLSASSLHQHFKQVTSMSPLQYQKLLRLHEARRLLLAEGLDAAAAAHRVGYESPSQFSREYSRCFGAPPRAQARALRQAAAQALGQGS
ncbi:MAG: AraC family transcriptional regulator [Rubrivivax sp.]